MPLRFVYLDVTVLVVGGRVEKLLVDYWDDMIGV